jgi:DNA modification methylase/SAM-dependent methyltransferase
MPTDFFETSVSPVDALSVAILTTAIKLGMNIEQWAIGGKPSSYWVKQLNITSLEFHSSTSGLTLDDWDLFTKNRYISYARSHLENLVDFFSELRILEDKVDSKIRGAIYTPSWLSNKITRDVFDHWRRLHRNGKVPKLIADVSCGTGSFLFHASNFFGRECAIVGIDTDPNALVYCELLSRVVSADWTLKKTDSLLNETNQLSMLANNDSYTGTIDILLGNPPYIRSQLLGRQYATQLRKLYPDITQGNFDLSILFLEHAVRALSEGGIASYILSSKFMASKYGASICKRLASNMRIINIEDFGDTQLFDGRTTYTCILTFAKLPPAKRFTVTAYPSGLNNARGLIKGQSFTLSSERLIAHPWDFANGEEQTALNKLRDARNPLLTEVFTGIIQGVRTGANQVFLIDPASSDLESDLLLPFVSGEDIRRMHSKANKFKLLFPYKRNSFGEPILLSENELRRQYPKTLNYLVSKKSILLERSVEKGAAWFGYSRTQNLSSAWIRKLLVREMMPRAEFAADSKGEIAFSSGYALVANRMTYEDLLLWTAILNTQTMEFVLRRNGTQLHSGWFRLLKHHLTRVRLPLLESSYKSSAKQIAKSLIEQPDNDKLWRRLDDIVAQGFGLTDKERQSIFSFLTSCYERSLSEKTNSLIGTIEKQDIRTKYEPVRLDEYNALHIDRPELREAVTFVENKKSPIHRWYPLTQGFSERLVLALLRDLKASSQTIVLDPFAGCGTTNLVCRLEGIPSNGIEISPLMVWLANVKIKKWAKNELEDAIHYVKRAEIALGESNSLYFQSYLSKAYAPFILKQLCGIAEFVKREKFTNEQKDFLLAGLVGITEQVSLIRKHGSHYRFMNASENIGLQKLNTQLISPDADIKPIYMNKLDEMLVDICLRPMPTSEPSCLIAKGDARNMPFSNDSADIVITSPPYLNRNNYIAQQKTELALLGLVTNSEQYRQLVRQTLRSHVEAQFESKPQSHYEEVSKIIGALSLTENNNPKIPHMIAGYFEDLGLVIRELSRVVKKGGECAFVVANSRWGGIVVPVDHLLMKIAEQNGFEATRILVTRLKGNSPQQMRRYGRIPLRESIVVFKKL